VTSLNSKIGVSQEVIIIKASIMPSCQQKTMLKPKVKSWQVPKLLGHLTSTCKWQSLEQTN